MPRNRSLAVCVALLLLFWGTRLITIQRFPPFIDEVQHVHEAEQAFLGHPFAYVGEGRLLSIWWLTPFQPYRGATLFVMRAAVLLIVLLGFAALLGMGKIAAGYWGALVCGLLYLFSLYHVFFDRLALADPMASAAVTLGLYFAYRLSKRVTDRDAVLTGAALFFAVGFKATTLPYLGIPLAAALTLWPPKRTVRQNLRWGVVAVVTELGLVAAYFLVLTRFRGNPFGFISLYNSWTSLPVLTRTLNNFLSTTDLLLTYGGIAFGVLLLVFVVMRWPHKWFFMVCLLAPALVLWINQRYYSRYYNSVVLIFVLCGALALAAIAEKRKVALIGGILLVFGLRWVGFSLTAATQPDSLPLWSVDQSEYIQSDASGFGIQNALDILNQHGATEVIGSIANCDGLRYLSWGQFKVICPNMNPNGSSIDSITALMSDNRRVGTYAILQESSYLPSSAPGQQIATFTHPGGKTIFHIYDLAP